MLRHWALLVVWFCFLYSANASSRQPPPLKRVAHPTHVSLQILPRANSKRSLLSDLSRPAYDDFLRLTVHIYDSVYHLHLRPHEELIHPAARVKHYSTSPNGRGSVLRKVEPLRREDWLVYEGEVIDDAFTDKRLNEDFAGGIWRPHYLPTPDGQRGWARVMLLDAGNELEGREPLFEGAFSVDGVIYHVLTREAYLRNMQPSDPYPEGDLVIFRDTDVHQPSSLPQSCAHDRLGYNVDSENPVLKFGRGDRRSKGWLEPFGLLTDDVSAPYDGLFKRQGDIGGGGFESSDFVDTIGQTAGCPMTQQIIYMGVVSDCAYTATNGGNTNATQSILRNFNTVSLLYKSTFNISLGIVELQVSDPTCPTSDPNNPWNVPCGSVSLNERLSLFSAWRGANFEALSDQNSDPTGLWHLMSGCPSGTEVGVAWLGTVCQRRSSGNAPSIVSGTAVSTGGRTEWQVVAHEIGHNLGAIHDCTSTCTIESGNCCPLSRDSCNSQNQFLMNPTSSAQEQNFSPCTIGNICSLMGSMNIDTSCIQPPDLSQRTFSLQMCGNGILESGEECDPGAGSNSACCDPDTCRLRPGAVCDPSTSTCCTDSCQYAPRGMVCRPARDEKCDSAEVCTGESSECPEDVVIENGKSCGVDGLACANGICTSVSQQCRTVGATLNLSEACSTPDSTCQVSCQDPLNPAQCVVLNSQLIDGSPCGYGGTCVSGNCRPGSFLETVIAWYTKNLQISIPVSVVVGILALIILWWLLSSLKKCLVRRKPKRTATISAIPPATPATRLPSWTPGMPLPGGGERERANAGPFNVPPQRVERGGIGNARRNDRPADWRPSDSSDRARHQIFPQQPSYARDASQGNSAGVGRRLMQEEDRGRNGGDWVDDTLYNGPRR